MQADIWDELYYNTEDFDAEEIQLPGPIAEWPPLTIPVTADPPELSLDAVNLPDEIELISPKPASEQLYDGGTAPGVDTVPLEQQQEEELDTVETSPVANPVNEPSSAEPQLPDPVCSPPVAEEPAQPPETESDESDEKAPDKQRMLVQFIVTINNFTETSFESRGRGILVQAIKNTTRQFEASEGLGVQAQTKFEAEDSAAALEFTDALSTSPTSIFQEQQFGNVTVPDVDLVPISDSISWIPIVLGAAAGLAVCMVGTLVHLKKQASSYHPAYIPEVGETPSIFQSREDDQTENQYIRASWTHGEKSPSDPPANSRLNLLGSISSKKYTPPSDTYSGRELVVNNLGLYSDNK
eukprot:jgi/Picsp_1/1215/NSC_04696-R1_---NA---